MDSILAIPIVVNGAVKAVVSVGLPKLSKKKEMDIINLCCIVANKVSLEFVKMEQHVATEKKSITDKLTGLYNRQFFDAKIKDELNNAKLENRKLAYVEIDLDFFKQMNDTHGHEFGDMVLKTAADIFKKNIRNSDYAFRQGGDEFSLLLLGVDSPKAYDIVKHIKIEYAKKVEELHLYAKKDGVDVKSSFSIGIAVYPHPKVEDAKDRLPSGILTGMFGVVSCLASAYHSLEGQELAFYSYRGLISQKTHRILGTTALVVGLGALAIGAIKYFSSNNELNENVKKEEQILNNLKNEKNIMMNA